MGLQSYFSKIINQLRKPERLSWRETCRRIVIKVYGEEYLHDSYYFSAYKSGFGGFSLTQGRVLALRKLINPFKLPELIIVLFADITDKLCQQLGDWCAAKLMLEELDMPLSHRYGFFTSLSRGIVKLLFWLPLVTIKYFTSPVNSIIRPSWQLAKNHPFQLIFILTSALLLASIVGMSVFTGGIFLQELNFLLNIPYFTWFVDAIAESAVALTALITVNTPFFISVSAIELFVQVSFVIVSFLASLAVLQSFTAKLTSFTQYLHSWRTNAETTQQNNDTICFANDIASDWVDLGKDSTPLSYETPGATESDWKKTASSENLSLYLSHSFFGTSLHANEMDTKKQGLLYAAQQMLVGASYVDEAYLPNNTR